MRINSKGVSHLLGETGSASAWEDAGSIAECGGNRVIAFLRRWGVDHQRDIADVSRVEIWNAGLSEVNCGRVEAGGT